MTRLTAICGLALALMLTNPHALAHHSHASLDMNDLRTYKGVVSRYSWTMPHVFLKIDALDENGNVREYTVELNHPPYMRRAGWSKETFRPGDEITWYGPHDKDPERHYTGLVWAERGDGTRFGMELSTDPGGTPSTDFTGLWKRSDEGGFKPHYRPPSDWPLSERGQALVDGFHESQNPMINCGNPGPPKSMIVPYPMSITRPDEKTIFIERELMKEVRVIYLAEPPPPGPPSANGFSVGRFEGNELVVETNNFVADKWGMHTGIDSSEQKQLVERYRLSDDGLYLHAEFTITDPVYLSKPHTFTHRWMKLEDRDVIQAPCTMEAAKLFQEAGYGENKE